MFLKLQENHSTLHGPQPRSGAGALRASAASRWPRMTTAPRRKWRATMRKASRISEFPVSLEAGRAARRLNMRIIAGAPNIVRGGSHSGNVAVTDLIRAGALDALASDYVPAAMLEAAFCAVARRA